MAARSNSEFTKMLASLGGRIVKNFTSSDWLSLGMATDHFDLIDNHGRLLRSLSFGDDDYEGHALSVLNTIVQDDPENIAIIEEFVRERYPDPTGDGKYVSSHNEPGRRIVFTPSVFKVPDAVVNKRLVSVMMPFDASMNEVHAVVKAAARDARLECQRVDDIWEDSTVIQDVFSLIFRSFTVVCDFSRRNANVFYEAGIAHTLGKHVVPITQSTDDIPFDLRHYRHLVYLNNAEGRAALQDGLTKRLQQLAESD